mmetsp:Transcript_160831/g.516180  ORF Transcript_160831/g.516180 Transcript_160831/m.516180 type:complete len:290 (-) Transcript_160831:813-1682(-)
MLMPQIKKITRRTMKAQKSDLAQPNKPKIIMRSSRKNRMMRITRTTRTILRTRMTRKIEVFETADDCCWNKGQTTAKKSNTLKTTTTTSKIFHVQSEARKKSIGPSAAHRKLSSMQKMIQKMPCRTATPMGSSKDAKLTPDAAISRTRSAWNSVCQPMNNAFSKITNAVISSKKRLEMKRWSGVCVDSTSSRLFLLMKVWTFLSVLFFDFLGLLSRSRAAPNVSFDDTRPPPSDRGVLREFMVRNLSSVVPPPSEEVPERFILRESRPGTGSLTMLAMVGERAHPLPLV